MGESKIATDPRIDPRIKAVLGALDFGGAAGDAESREQLLEEANTEDAIAVRELVTAFLGMCDTEEIAPSKGLTITEHTVVSEPDGNTINIRFIRPEGDDVLPCVYYIHGGGMQTMSCYDGNYRAWGRIIAAQGVAVAMVDFRNALVPSSVDEVAPFPAGLNDCVSGVKWVAAHNAELAIDPDRIVVAGESGGGNLTLATGLRLHAGRRPRARSRGSTRCARTSPASGRMPENPSSIENNGILLDLHNNRGAMAYGIEEFEQAQPARLAGLRDRRRRARPRADDDQRQRVRPAARRGRQLLPAAAARRRRRALPPGDGHDPRHRDLADAVPRHQPRHRSEHRRLRPHRRYLTRGRRRRCRPMRRSSLRGNRARASATRATIAWRTWSPVVHSSGKPRRTAARPAGLTAIISKP